MREGSKWALYKKELFQWLNKFKMMQTLYKGIDICQSNPFPFQVGLVLFYRVCLDFLYITVLSPNYAYAGFTTNIAPLPYGISLLALIAFAPFIVGLIEDGSPSSCIVTFINHLYFIPLTSYFGCKGADLKFFLTALIYWAILLLLQYRIPKLNLALPHRTLSYRVVLGITALSALFVFFISGKYTGFRFTMDFFNVYGIRSEAAGYQMPSIFSYILSMLSVVLAYSILYWLYQKKYVVSGFMVIVFLFYFSIGAHKSHFFFLFLIFSGFLLYRPWMLRWISGLCSVLTGVALLEYRILGSFYILSLFIRRVMYVPVHLSESCAQLFTTNSLNLFRDGIMRRFSFDSIYPIKIVNLLGEFEGNIQTNANNGLLGDLFVNLPILLGLLLLPLILVFCFRFADLMTQRLERRITMAFYLYFAGLFINTSWSTVFLTGGYLIALVLFCFFPKKEGVRS